MILKIVCIIFIPSKNYQHFHTYNRREKYYTLSRKDVKYLFGMFYFPNITKRR